MKVVNNKFPQQVFVKWEDMDGEPYLSVTKTAQEHLDTAGPASIATYELKEIRRGSLVPQFSAQTENVHKTRPKR